MRRLLRALEEPYRSRALPPGTPRYWSWWFAAREARDALLGIYALTAEWRALMDPGIEAAVAQLKLAWWQEEVRRLAAGAPLHPITRYLAHLPLAAHADFAPLRESVAAAGAQVAGAPLERAGELQSHAYAMHGAPLRVAAQLAGVAGGPEVPSGVHACLEALAAGEYLSRAVADYGREARRGRVPFAVEELLAAGIENDDLAADTPPPRLEAYLLQARRRAAGYFAAAATALGAAERSALRHLPVLAALGAKRLKGRPNAAGKDIRLGDLYDAWNAARRAAR